MEIINFIIAVAALILAGLAYHRTTNNELNSIKDQINSFRETAAEAIGKVENSIRPGKEEKWFYKYTSFLCGDKLTDNDNN